MASERWLPIPGHVGMYEVSDRGRVRSLDRIIMRKNGIPRKMTGRVLAARPMSNGYLRVSLGLGNDSLVHRLVLLAFVGPCPDGLECCHANDNKTDNRLDNLRWDTRSANRFDLVRNGRHRQAAQSHCKRGHDFAVTTRFRPGTQQRICTACERRRNRLNRIKKMEEAK